MSPKPLLLFALLLVACRLQVANAGLINLVETDSGQVDYRYSRGITCVTTPSATHSSPMQTIGIVAAPCAPFGGIFVVETSGYFLFDLTSVGSTVTGAELSLAIAGLDGIDGVLRLYDYTLTSPTDLANLPTGPLSPAFAVDFGTDVASGNLLGEQVLASGAATGDYQLPLSSFALDQINTSGGLYAIGVSYIPNNVDFVNEIRFGGPARLALQVSSNAIPGPASGLLLTVGLAGLALSRRKSAALQQ